MDFLTKELVFINELDKESTRHLVQLLKKLFQVVPVGESVPVSVSHGDFTPWNMYCDEQRLYVYDWEMARNGMPMLFDLFHFTYQSLILQQRKGYAEVKDTINQWTDSTFSTATREEVSESSRASSRPLSFIQCKSLPASVSQRTRTADAESMDDERMDIGDRRLPRIDTANSRKIMNQRKAFLAYFFKAIKPFRYALLKFIHESIDALPGKFRCGYAH
jgi:aminoglycoside phosphotransferase (APT) family kinase protein